MNIKKSRIVEIIKEELDDSLKPQPLDPAALEKIQKWQQTSGLSIKDLILKVEQLSSRISKLEQKLKVTPTREETWGDTEYADLGGIEK